MLNPFENLTEKENQQIRCCKGKNCKMTFRLVEVSSKPFSNISIPSQRSQERGELDLSYYGTEFIGT